MSQKKTVKLDIHDVSKIEIREWIGKINEGTDRPSAFKTIDITIYTKNPYDSQAIIVKCFMKRVRVHVRKTSDSLIERTLEVSPRAAAPMEETEKWPDRGHGEGPGQ